MSQWPALVPFGIHFVSYSLLCGRLNPQLTPTTDPFEICSLFVQVSLDQGFSPSPFFLIKSVPAKVTRAGDSYQIVGAAWGAPIARVEVQVDGGAWQTATIDESEQAEFAWKLWSIDWPDAEMHFTAPAFMADFAALIAHKVTECWCLVLIGLCRFAEVAGEH